MRTRARNVRAVVVAAILALLLLLLTAVVGGPREEVRAQGAAADYFLKIEGIEGEAVTDGHVGEIEVQSWSWGESNPTRLYGTGAGVGKVSMKDFTIVKKADKATPQLMLACAVGRRIPSATLTARRNGVTFMRWELKNVIISSYQTQGDQVTGPPTEEVKIRFTQIVLTHFVQNSDGTVSTQKVGYDLAKGKSI